MSGGFFKWERIEGLRAPAEPTDPTAPIVLIAKDDPHEGVISARREGEPSFVWVQSGWDAVMAAASRGVELHIPASLMPEIRSEFPPDLPQCIRIVDA
jgi:hypothetical protein